MSYTEKLFLLSALLSPFSAGTSSEQAAPSAQQSWGTQPCPGPWPVPVVLSVWTIAAWGTDRRNSLFSWKHRYSYEGNYGMSLPKVLPCSSAVQPWGWRRNWWSSEMLPSSSAECTYTPAHIQRKLIFFSSESYRRDYNKILSIHCCYACWHQHFQGTWEAWKQIRCKMVL